MTGTDRVRVAAAVILRGDRVLMTQRPPGDPLGLFWEFPGGKIERGESPDEALVRELREELGVAARPLRRLGVHRHDYEHGMRVEIVFVEVEIEEEGLEPSAAVHGVRWTDVREASLDDILAADRPFMASLRLRADRGTRRN